MNSNHKSGEYRYQGDKLISYDDWNLALFTNLFAGVEPNQSVYLYVHNDLIKEIGERLFGLPREHAVESFCQAVQSYCSRTEEIFERATIRGERWFSQDKDRVPPPFLAVLGLCVLAATHMAPDEQLSVGGGNYYVRLRQLLSLEGRTMPRKFDRSTVLWQLLSKWQTYQKGRYGYTHSFTFDVAIHSGYPRSQCLIRKSELPMLFDFFQRMGYSPGQSIPEYRLEQDLDTFLSVRVGRLVDQFSRTKTLRKAIVACVQNELDKWNPDGRDEEIERIEGIVKLSRQKIRLLLDVESTYFSTSVRVLFLVPNTARSVQANERTPFVYKNGGYQYCVTPEDNLLVDQEFHLPDLQSRWVFVAKKLFVFYSNPAQAIHDWEDQSLLRKGKEHVFLFHVSMREELDLWVRDNNCQVIETYEDAEIHLAKDWQLMKLEIPKVLTYEQWLADLGIRVESEEATSIRLEQGLPLGQNQWLYQAPWPHLEVMGEARSTVLLNEVEAFSILGKRAVLPVNHIVSRPGAYRLELAYSRSRTFVLRESDIDFLATLPGYAKPQTVTTDYGAVDVSGLFLEFQEEPPIFPSLMQKDGLTYEMTARNQSLSRKLRRRTHEQPYARSFRKSNVRLKQGPVPDDRPIDKLLEYLTLRGHGNWETFCLGVERFFGEGSIRDMHYIRKNFSRIGAVEFVKRPAGGYEWYVVQPTAIFLPSLFQESFMALTGGRTIGWINQLQDSLRDGVSCEWTVPSSEWEPMAVYVASSSLDVLEEELRRHGVRIYETLEYLAHDLVRILPTLDQMVEAAPECGDLTLSRGSKEGWSHTVAAFTADGPFLLYKHENPFAPIQYTIGHDETCRRKVSKGLGLTSVASQLQLSVISYDSYCFRIKAPYQLPDLYDRALTACSCRIPTHFSGYWEYTNVPLEIALLVSFKLNLNLHI